MKKRKGASLAELLMVMSAGTFILTLSAGLIHRVMHAQSRTRSFVEQERTALRLAYAFRSDVHQARNVVAERGMLGEKELARLDVAENTITYLAHEGKVVRLVVAGGKNVAREDYQFADHGELQIRREASGIVVLTLDAPPEETRTSASESRKDPFIPKLSLEIAALPARDLPRSVARTGQEESQ